jgi:hypothetical protein
VTSLTEGSGRRLPRTPPRRGVDVTPAGFDPEGAITRLKDGSFIIWRPPSSDGTPALEFDTSRGKVKLRYRGWATSIL